MRIGTSRPRALATSLAGLLTSGYLRLTPSHPNGQWHMSDPNPSQRREPSAIYTPFPYSRILMRPTAPP